MALDPRESDLMVTVSDDGVGIPEDTRGRSEGRGFGLSMIEGIAPASNIAGGDGTDAADDLPDGPARGRDRRRRRAGSGSGRAADPARLVAVVAAQNDMPSDRVVEALLLAELVARNALRHLIGDRAQVSITSGELGFELRVGPLEKGGADAAVADSDVPVVGPVIERLSDATATEPVNSTEFLVVRIS